MTTFAAEAGTAQHFYGGAWQATGSVAESTDPATGKVLGQFYNADLAVARDAIAAARKAFDGGDWAKNRELRAKVLNEMADAMDEHVEDVIQALMAENGKIRPEATFEASLCGPRLRYHAAQALTDLGHASEVRDGVVSMLLKEPVGVAAVITPWNSPVILAIRSIAPALAAGCTVVVKMPGQTALAGNLMTQLLAVPSLPSGVLNIFTESGNDGARELVSSPDSDVVSYTGSTVVGAQIMADAAPLLKRVSLELGGKTPMIVFNDADLNVVVPTLLHGITTFAGQFCMTGSRILVQAGIADRLRTRLAAALEGVQPGPAADPSSHMGPMIDKAATARVDKLLTDAHAAGEFEFVVRGGAVEGPGAFYKPVLIEVNDVSSRLIQDEIFGPVATLETFTNEAYALSRANATKYGLAASVWTSSIGTSMRMTSGLKAGTVRINNWGQVVDAFEEGGFKSSGLGRLGGPGGLAEFQETKHVMHFAGRPEEINEIDEPVAAY